MYIQDLTADGLIAKTALEAVQAQFEAQTLHAIDSNQLQFELDTVGVTLTVTAREYVNGNLPGQFVGSLTLPYLKASITVCLPYPIFVNLNYPTNYALLRTTLKNDYGVVLEENDLCLTPGGTPIDDSTPLSNPVDNDHVMTLYTSTASGRFLAGDKVQFIFATERLGRSLSQALQQNTIPSLKSIMFNDVSMGWSTVFGATDAVIACELLKRYYGEEFDSSDININIIALDWHRCVIQLNGNIDNPVWRGYTEFHYEKASIEEAIIDSLMVNMTYPVPFDVLNRYLQTTFGLQLGSGEFALGGVYNTPLKNGDWVDTPLDSENTISLYVRRESTRWIGREVLRLQFNKSISDFHEDLFGGNAPTQFDDIDYTFSYQPANMDPEEPVTYAVVAGTPPRPLSEDGVYSGTPLAGFYTWTVAAYGFGGGVALQTEFVEIQHAV